MGRLSEDDIDSIIDTINILRSNIAQGILEGKPPAKNMMEIVSWFFFIIKSWFQKIKIGFILLMTSITINIINKLWDRTACKVKI